MQFQMKDPKNYYSSGTNNNLIVCKHRYILLFLKKIPIHIYLQYIVGACMCACRHVRCACVGYQSTYARRIKLIVHVETGERGENP
jgi:hypothetical protein